MKKSLAIFILMITVLFTACGGGGSSDSGASTPPSTSTSVSMVIDQVYTMSAGESIEKDSEPTEVVLETDINTGVTQATLTSGSASLVTN